LTNRFGADGEKTILEKNHMRFEYSFLKFCDTCKKTGLHKGRDFPQEDESIIVVSMCGGCGEATAKVQEDGGRERYAITVR